MPASKKRRRWVTWFAASPAEQSSSETTAPSDEQQGTQWAQFITDQLEREYTRFDQFNTRAAGIVSAAATLVTISVAAIAISKGQHDTSVSWPQIMMFVVALLPLLLSAVLGVIVGGIVGEHGPAVPIGDMQSVPGCHELHRDLAAATERAGVAGALAMQITHELGTIDSVSRTRIITTEQETLIAQLTVTALHDSPVDRSNVWLTVRMDAAAGPVSADQHSSVPVAGTRTGH
jgi:hypothetical protein